MGAAELLAESGFEFLHRPPEDELLALEDRLHPFTNDFAHPLMLAGEI